MKKIYLAGGCFWGVEHFFSLIDGIIETNVGYANGIKENPNYEEVCSQKYQFAETVEVVYDENTITLNKILDKFFKIINPTSLNKQGNDIGLQYRTGIYFINKEDMNISKQKLIKLQEKYSDNIKIELLPLVNFYLAEKYHQQYLYKNPNGYCHIPLDLFKKANEL